LRELTRYYLDKFGFESVQTYLVYHQWMGQFPAQQERAAALIAGSAIISSMISADKIVVKTIDEALGVPRPEINAEACDTVRYVLRTFRSAETLTSPMIERETALIASETANILDAVFDLSGTAFWESVFRAFQLGYLDVPFSPHMDNANKLLSVRDANGSIRIADAAAVPISIADARLEKELLESRGDREDKTYRQMLTDIRLMV
jgi:methylaspartate mutase epsilon subunit